MDLGIKGKIALVTGGSRGLGRQSSLSLAKEGVHVAICARGKDAISDVVEEVKQYGVNGFGIVADMTSSDSIKELFDTVSRKFGSISILVNNVGGRLGGKDLEDTSDEEFRQTVELNLFSTLTLTRLVIPEMKQNKWGRIINIASIYGREHGGALAYMSAKAGLIAMTKHLSLELVKTGITVNSVAPGSIFFKGGSWDRFISQNTEEDVNKFIETNLPMGKFGWPEPIGDTVAFLSSKNADLITGSCINVDGGQSTSLI